MGDVVFEASAYGAVSSPMLSFRQNGVSGYVSVSLSVCDASEAPADSVTYTPAIPAIQTRPSDEFSACEIIMLRLKPLLTMLSILPPFQQYKHDPLTSFAPAR